MPEPDFVPRIQTPRLVLRAYRVEEFDDFAEDLRDPVVTKYLSGVLDRRTAWRVFAASQGFWMLHRAGWWAVEEIETRMVVGTVGAFFRETSPELEIGWRIYRSQWGRGFAKESAGAALQYGFGAFPIDHAVAYITAGNEASVGVARAVGLRWEREADLYGDPVGRYVVARP